MCRQIVDAEDFLEGLVIAALVGDWYVTEEKSGCLFAGDTVDKSTGLEVSFVETLHNKTDDLLRNFLSSWLDTQLILRLINGLVRDLRMWSGRHVGYECREKGMNLLGA
jgi:hypothetical protein